MMLELTAEGSEWPNAVANISATPPRAKPLMASLGA
jgi:hypothetical protein